MIGTDHDFKHTVNVHGAHGNECGRGVRLSSRPRPPATVITVSGDVDVCNAEQVRDYIAGFVHVDQPLVLDLSGVKFLGIDGFRAVLGFAAACRRAKREWALVSSAAVNVLLGPSVGDDRLPIVGSVDEALQRFAALPNAPWRFHSLTPPECKRP